MSVLDEIRKLDEQKNKLLEGAKRDAMKKAQTALAELGALGFEYDIVEKGTPPRKTTGTRRTGIRQEVLSLIHQSPQGISRSDLLDKLDAKGDKSAEQSISNALSALKKQKAVTGDGGIYKVVA